jgi:hypothetical protein
MNKCTKYYLLFLLLLFIIYLYNNHNINEHYDDKYSVSTKLVASNKIYDYWFSTNNYFSMQDDDKFKNYFLSFIDFNKIKYNSFKLYDIQDINEKFKMNIINIMICVENCKFGNHFKHINKYNDFGNNNISIYLYNHYNHFIQTSNYIVIPIIYLQIDYFKTNYNIINPSIYTDFSNKKFCLMISRDKQNRYSNILNKLEDIGIVDNIKLHHNKIKNKSCYHSKELLNLFNEYKFIFCFENSFTDGYITEKIFNVFFSKAIPLYMGPSDTNKYFNYNAYINIENINDEIINKITELAINKELYNTFINENKINKFDNQNYVNKSKLFINERIRKFIK